jgi:hypothetical protein
MSVPKQDIPSRHFQRKISEFCELRIAPIAPKRVLENIRPYLINLIIYRKPPPILNGRLDWTTYRAEGWSGEAEARGYQNRPAPLRQSSGISP